MHSTHLDIDHICLKHLINQLSTTQEKLVAKHMQKMFTPTKGLYRTLGPIKSTLSFVQTDANRHFHANLVAYMMTPIVQEVPSQHMLKQVVNYKRHDITFEIEACPETAKALVAYAELTSRRFVPVTVYYNGMAYTLSRVRSFGFESQWIEVVISATVLPFFMPSASLNRIKEITDSIAMYMNDPHGDIVPEVPLNLENGGILHMRPNMFHFDNGNHKTMLDFVGRRGLVYDDETLECVDAAKLFGQRFAFKFQRETEASPAIATLSIDHTFDGCSGFDEYIED